MELARFYFNFILKGEAGEYSDKLLYLI